MLQQIDPSEKVTTEFSELPGNPSSSKSRYNLLRICGIIVSFRHSYKMDESYQFCTLPLRSSPQPCMDKHLPDVPDIKMYRRDI